MRSELFVPAGAAILLVLLPLGAALAMVAGTPHDLSTGTTTEVCSYCHTPHGGSSISMPLWNRYIDDPSAFIMYGSDTMNSVVDARPAPTSLACLSCHDYALSGGWGGAVLVNTHEEYNPPGDTPEDYNCYSCHNGGGATLIPEWFQIGPNLTDDHPISFPYPTPSVDPKFNVPPDLIRGWPDVPLFNGRIECSTCHNPHDNSFGNFLRRSNSGSALCLTCHQK